MIAQYIIAKFKAFGWYYNEYPAVLEEITSYCQRLEMTPEQFDETIERYRRDNIYKPSGIISLKKYLPVRPLQPDSRRAADVIFSAIESYGWQQAISEIMSGEYGYGAMAFIAVLGVNENGQPYNGLPQSWREYFKLLHQGCLYEALEYRYRSTGNELYRDMAQAAKKNYRQIAGYFPYVLKKLKTGEIVPPPEAAEQFYS